MEFWVSAARGTEAALRDELGELGFGELRIAAGGVRLRGPWEDGWRACLESRIAQRVLVSLARFDAADGDSLYAGVRAIDWDPYLTAGHTLAVTGSCRDSSFRHSGFIALKTKDAIVDQLRDRHGSRPSVARNDPDVHVFVYILNDRATVYLDLAGVPLHRRGYRTRIGEAPLKETLAAALLRLAGWDRATPLVDPMCGSGTIGIEAALWAASIAPGIARPRFGFERWALHDEAAAARLSALRQEARARAHGQAPRILLSDIDPQAVEDARANARAAGVRVGFRCCDLADLAWPGPPALVVTNPPYGERLSAGAEFLRRMASSLCRLHGYRVGVLAGAPAIAKAMPLRPAQEFPLYNGDIPCRFLLYEVP